MRSPSRLDLSNMEPGSPDMHRLSTSFSRSLRSRCTCARAPMGIREARGHPPCGKLPCHLPPTGQAASLRHPKLAAQRAQRHEGSLGCAWQPAGASALVLSSSGA